MDPEKKSPKLTRHPKGQSILVKDTNIWTHNRFLQGSLLIQNGKIKRIARRITGQTIPSLDGSGLYALPGLVDVHVHLRDMKLNYKEDFVSGTAAAAAGGFTTVLDMPNTVPPTDSQTRLFEKMSRAERKIRVNVGFHAAASADSKTVSALARAGAFSLKLYMPKPIAPFEVDNDETIRELLDNSRIANIPVTVHAEDFAHSNGRDLSGGFEQMALSRPPLLETKALERILKIQKKAHAKIHFCHITLGSSLQTLNSGSKRITSEVTPHHLLLSASLLRKLGWRAWMVPPLRSRREQKALLKATAFGLADTIASDHAPHSISEKDQSPRNSPPGVPGLETTTRLMLTLVNKGILSTSILVKMLAERPAKIFGLHRKGRLKQGFDGDVVLVDPKKKLRIDSSVFFSKAKFSPFDGLQTIGTVRTTIVGGRVIYDQGELVGPQGSGSVLENGLPD